jgi:predicted RNA binding protein YcfA (HicA-like mRNA interferase family)
MGATPDTTTPGVDGRLFDTYSTRLSCTVIKTVHRLLEREGFAANHPAIDALHSEIRKDGYVYVGTCGSHYSINDG